ncbi:MAG: hypothetical protein ACTSUY_00995, partial [Alphaproteobacteria bacterium]
MTKRPIKRKFETSAPRRVDPAARPKAVIDAVAKEVGGAKSASAKRHEPGHPGKKPAQPAPTERPKSATPPAQPLPGKLPGTWHLVAAGAVGAVGVLAVLLVFRFASEPTAHLVAQFSGASAVEQRLAVAVDELARLRQEMSGLAEKALANDAFSRAALAKQAQQIVGLDSQTTIAAAGQEAVQSLTQKVDRSTQGTEQLTATISELENQITKITQTTNQLVVRQVASGG